MDARIAAATAYRVRLIRLAAGGDDFDESVEWEAGAILEAEKDHEAHNIHEMIKSWIEAHNKRA